jgi:predicted kinase
MATAIVLYGPKAVGKSWVARTLVERLGVHHVDVDRLVMDLLASGARPDPVAGWLAWVERRLGEALGTHDLVSVEATGAWDSDWRLADDLEAMGVGVVRVWVIATKEVALGRLAARTATRAPMSAEEASRIYDSATAQAAGRRLDLRLDTNGAKDPGRVVGQIKPLLG